MHYFLSINLDLENACKNEINVLQLTQSITAAQ